MPFDEKYFSTNTYQDVSFSRYSQYWWSNRLYAKLAKKWGKQGSKLLEVGSGLGHLVGQLENCFQTFGTEINPWAIKMSISSTDKTLFADSNAEELPFSSRIFGVVIIKHVIEHLTNPESAISEIGRVIAPGGTLIFSTPNLFSFLKPLKGKNWIGYRDPTHISLKPPPEWISLLQRHGFLIKHIYSDGFWDAPYMKGIPKVIQKFVLGSLGGFQAITGVMFLPMRWGESIIVIAKKEY